MSTNETGIPPAGAPSPTGGQAQNAPAEAATPANDSSKVTPIALPIAPAGATRQDSVDTPDKGRE